MKSRSVLILLALICISCSPVFAESSIYEMLESKSGDVFSLNRQNGEVHLVTKSGLRNLSERHVVLRVGDYYEMEDSSKQEKFLKYLGNAKFEKSDFSVRVIAD